MALVGLAIDMTTLDVVEGRGAEGQRRMRGVFAAAHNVNVGGVVDARGRRHVTLIEDAFVNRQDFTGAGGHEHDVHEALFNYLLDDLAKLGQAAIAQFAAMGFRRLAGRADGESHVGVLGIGKDEILAAARVGVDALQLAVQRFFNHGCLAFIS